MEGDLEIIKKHASVHILLKNNTKTEKQAKPTLPTQPGCPHTKCFQAF
jgi:hypothetical protein